MAMISSFLKKWRQRNGAVETNPRSFVVVDGRRGGTMEWTAVQSIELVREPSLIVEWFFVRMRSQAQSLVIADSFDGFETFRLAVLERWPHIEQEWKRIYTGKPDVTESLVVWSRAD